MPRTSSHSDSRKKTEPSSRNAAADDQAFLFPGYEKNLQPIEWDAWLAIFLERELVFLYQETQSAGNQSNFFRLDSPEREDG